MDRSDRVIKTTFIYFLGNFASKILGFILLPFYTVYLSREDFGTIDILMSIVPLIAPLFTLQVTDSVFRFLITDKVEKRKITITNAMVIFCIGMMAFIILYLSIVNSLIEDYGILFLLYYIATYVGFFLQQVLRGLGRTLDYALTGVISTVIHATLNIFLLVKIGLGGESLLISSISGSAIISLYICIKIRIWEFISIRSFSASEVRRQLDFGVPLIPNQIAWWVIGLFGKYILTYNFGISYNGILAVASRFPNLITIISTIFLQAWTENIIKEYFSDDRDEFFSTSLTRFTILMVTVTACILPVIRIYTSYAIKGDFFESWLYIPILMIGSLFNAFSAFLGTIYTASTDTKHAFTTTFVSAVSNLVLSIICIPIFSIWGVVGSNMISFLLLYYIRIKSINSLIKLNINFNSLLPSWIILALSIIIYYSYGTWIQGISCIAFGICTLYMNRSMLLIFWSFIKKIYEKRLNYR